MKTLGDNDALRQLNHVEMVYRPGERGARGPWFELLGLRVVDPGGRWLFALGDPALADFSKSRLRHASEATPEQWALEQALDAAIGTDGDVRLVGGGGEKRRVWAARPVPISTGCGSSPSGRSTSGSGSSKRGDFDATLDRIRAAASPIPTWLDALR